MLTPPLQHTSSIDTHESSFQGPRLTRPSHPQNAQSQFDVHARAGSSQGSPPGAFASSHHHPSAQYPPHLNGPSASHSNQDIPYYPSAAPHYQPSSVSNGYSSGKTTLKSNRLACFALILTFLCFSFLLVLQNPPKSQWLPRQ